VDFVLQVHLGALEEDKDGQEHLKPVLQLASFADTHLVVQDARNVAAVRRKEVVHDQALELAEKAIRQTELSVPAYVLSSPESEFAVQKPPRHPEIQYLPEQAALL
jgi:hypothetical protein